MEAARWKQIEELYHASRERGRKVLVGADPALAAGSGKLLTDSGGKILDCAAVHLLTESMLLEVSATEARASGGLDRVPVR